MRIDAFNQVTQLYQTTKPKKTAATEPKNFSDTLEISRAGRDFAVAKSSVQSAPDVRESKVAEIKAKMQAGTYNVSARDVAEKLLSGR